MSGFNCLFLRCYCYCCYYDYYYYYYYYCYYMCMCVMSMHPLRAVLMKAREECWAPLELVLQMVVSCHLGA